MTIEEAIEGLKSIRVFNSPKLNKIVEMAIAAFRAQQTPAKLDRSRWKGCDCCNANIYVKVKKYLRPLLAPATYVEELRDKLEDLTGEAYVGVPKKYCPICGRPLTEEAWTELESLQIKNQAPKAKKNERKRMKKSEHIKQTATERAAVMK